jgi:hypothetical protein
MDIDAHEDAQAVAENPAKQAAMGAQKPRRRRLSTSTPTMGSSRPRRTPATTAPHEQDPRS